MNANAHTSLQTRFIKEGYLHLENLPGRAAANAMRADVEEMTEKNDRVAVKASDILAHPTLMDAFLSNTLLYALRAVFDEGFVFMPAITIRKNWYEDWHIDAAFRGALGGEEAAPDFVQCALYWQPNLPGQGGGLSVIPGTHIRRQHHGCYMLDANYFNLSTSAKDVANKAGDYVIWDGRLVHRSTAFGPGAPMRLAMFMTVARASANYAQFIQHLGKRVISEISLGRESEAERFKDAAQLHLHDRVPAEILSRMQRCGAKFAP